MNPRRQRTAHLLGRLADAGEHDLGRIAAGRQHAIEFAARDDVETRAQTREQVQYRQVGVGFDGVADEMVAPGQRGIEGAEAFLDGGTRIDITGRANLVRDIGEMHVLGMQLPVLIGKGIHDGAM